ncbi:MAG: hypothetical protein ACKODX_06295 [Gemmata sp.]|jgi:hypothetical protein
MTPETEVIACPACRHLVRVPLDWLGAQVQCPECKARFRAPVRVDGKLTDAEPLSRPPGADAPKRRPRVDAMLLLPAFGLMMIGCAALAVGGATTARYLRDPGAPKQDVAQMVAQARRGGAFTAGPEGPDERAKFDDAFAEQRAGTIRALVPVFAVMSAFIFYGGVAMATRRHYRMAQLGCVLAVLHVAYGCCLPGALAGLWGLLMLSSAEGREHFGR